jgi:hypothetical protein
MGYSCRLYIKTIPNLLEVDSKLFFKKMSILQVAMFQNVLMDLKILREKKISLFFSMSFEIFVSFQKKLNICVFPISYKCEYVLFHLNMCCIWICWDYFKRLSLFFLEIKLISKKYFSLIYLIQGVNPHLLN